MKKLKPAEQQYAKEFEEYIDIKEKKIGFEKKLKGKKDWDNFNTKGSDSPSKTGLELKNKFSPKKGNNPQIIELEVAPFEMKHEELLNSFNEDDKEAFVKLRELYNSLDLV